MENPTWFNELYAEVVKTKSERIGKIANLFSRGIITPGVRDYTRQISKLDYLSDIINICYEREELSFERIAHLEVVAQELKQEAYAGLFDEWVESGEDCKYSLVKNYDEKHKSLLERLKKLSGKIICQN